MTEVADSPALWVQIVAALVVLIEIALVVTSLRYRRAAIDAVRSDEHGRATILFDECPKFASMAAFASIMPFMTLGLPGIARLVEGQPDTTIVELSNFAAVPLTVITGVMLLGYLVEMRLTRWWAEDQAAERAKREGVDA